MSSGGSYWYKEGRGRDGNQDVHDPVEHGRLDLHPSFLESIPMEICQHRSHAAGSFIIAFYKPGETLLTISSVLTLR